MVEQRHGCRDDHEEVFVREGCNAAIVEPAELIGILFNVVNGRLIEDGKYVRGDAVVVAQGGLNVREFELIFVTDAGERAVEIGEDFHASTAKLLKNVA